MRYVVCATHNVRGQVCMCAVRRWSGAVMEWCGDGMVRGGAAMEWCGSVCVTINRTTNPETFTTGSSLLVILSIPWPTSVA